MSARPRSRSLTILVVDDHLEMLSGMADFLEGEGHSVRLAPDGKLAFFLLFVEKQGAAVDVVISDVRMPEIDGIDLYRIVQARRPELAERFIFVTGTSLETDDMDGLQGATVPIVRKPFSLQTLSDAIRQIAER